MSGLVHRRDEDTDTSSLNRGGAGDRLAAPNSNGRSLRGKVLQSTPLQDFVKAKEKIHAVFGEIHKYVEDVTRLLYEVSTARDFIGSDAIAACAGFAATVTMIREVLARDHMKVVFFGRTSNGKSTVINSMLHSKVLPSGMGHTTRCFVQVEASKSGQKYILAGDSTEPQSLESIDQLAHALTDEDKFGEDTLVRVFWPRTDSKFLQNEVVLLDSPGVDVSPKFDEWIDSHCLDADVFVLVSNAESTLTHTEKNFFHRVNEKVSRPSIFILHNRWDRAEPEDMDRVRNQHSSRAVQFLVDELQVCTAEEAKHRIFFVSAKEMLTSRLREKGLQSPNSVLAEGYHARMIEFEDFEQQFEVCISHSAINTKFEAHLEKGQEVVNNTRDVLETVHGSLKEKSEAAVHEHDSKLESLKAAQSELQEYMRDVKYKLSELSDEVELKVSTDVTDEIRRLADIIEAFSGQFSADASGVMRYKQEVTSYADNILTDGLKKRVHGSLLPRVHKLEHDMLSRLCALLPEKYSPQVMEIIKFRKPFEFSFYLNCPALMESFQEDLEFRFSLGLTSIIRRFAQLRSASTVPRPISTPDTEYPLTPVNFGATEEAVMKSIIYSSATYVANGGIGLLLVGGLVYRTLGWRVIAAGGALYLGLYAYERLSWNNRAKEKTFKDQYRSHLATRLRHLNATITGNCAGQVTREMQEHLCRLQSVGSGAQDEMKREVDTLHKEIVELEQLDKTLSKTKNTAIFLNSELETFQSQFIQR